MYIIFIILYIMYKTKQNDEKKYIIVEFNL